jgi:hypothetical protein
LVRSNGRCEGGERRIREGEGRGKRIIHFGRDFIQEWRKGDFGGALGESELTVVTVGFTVHTVAEGFWARRARTSVDVLGPGALVGRVAGFGVFKRRFKLRIQAASG